MSLAIEETMTDQSVWRVGGEFGVSMTVYMYEEVHAQLHGHIILNMLSYILLLYLFVVCVFLLWLVRLS